MATKDFNNVKACPVAIWPVIAALGVPELSSHQSFVLADVAKLQFSNGCLKVFCQLYINTFDFGHWLVQLPGDDLLEPFYLNLIINIQMQCFIFAAANQIAWFRRSAEDH